MKNLRQKYEMETDKSRNSGNRTEKRKWKYFSKIEQDIVNPPSMVDPMAEISHGTLKDDTGNFF